jgi:hypothetical protein
VVSNSRIEFEHFEIQAFTISERGLEYYGLEQSVPLVVDEEEFKLASNTKDYLFRFRTFCLFTIQVIGFLFGI